MLTHLPASGKESDVTTPTETPATEPGPAPAPLRAPREYRFGRAVFIALMVGSALVLTASVVFMVLGIFGR